MSLIKKQTYIDLILSRNCNSDYLIAKSMTLDFLYGFENPYEAIVNLNKYISENRCMTRIRLSSIYGIILAVETYREFFPTVITDQFILTLMNIFNQKIYATSLDSYDEHMEKLISFIGDNITFKSMPSFMDKIGKLFIHLGTDEELIDIVFEHYCTVLKRILLKLMDKDRDILKYKIGSYQKVFLLEANNQNNEKAKLILEVLDSAIENKKLRRIHISSNTKPEIVEHVKERISYMDDIEIEEIALERFSKDDFDDNSRAILLIDVEEEYSLNMLYLCGILEGRMDESRFLPCFYNIEAESVKDNVYIKELFSRFANENNFEEKIRVFLEA